MSRLSWTLVWALAIIASPIIGQEDTQSPHGGALKIDCRACHTTESWSIQLNQLTFNHDTFRFNLTGQHALADCKSCHTNLKFEGAALECASCHLDVHFQSLGSDCKRCHNANAWIVDDVMEMHEEIAFPLMGVHAQINCFDCHQNAEQVRFLPVGTRCIDCHRDNYVMADRPNHVANGFSENCTECHNIFESDWGTDKIDHSFFPLAGGHDIAECASCHNVDNYSDVSAECVACHRDDYDNTSNPSHLAANIGLDCKQCHSSEADWVPADFVQHDMQYFPIYSGEHKDEWDQCIDCHTDPSDYKKFDCLTCHSNPETDDHHNGVQGYTYENQACLACHPTGSADESFDHNSTDFPLTGSHTMVSCEECHANGYKNTPTECIACHRMNYDESENPNHQVLGLSTDCASCHTTVPDWQPAAFDVHDDYYPLNGAHALIKMDCATCHNGDYNNTPNTCFACHQLEYDNTSDPDHNVLQFSQNCLDCHNELAWVPSTFDHDMRFFPIYSGSHQGEWAECIDCHTTPGDYTQFTCITCHQNPETDDAHQGVQGYSYNSSACLACHPTGDADVVFDHNNTNFPLTGAHVGTTCVECHAGGYSGTPTQCEACHLEDYNSSTNPNHTSLGLSLDCATCHTTQIGWQPASFDNHDDFYVLEGAHDVIRNDCAACHQGDYTNTPNTCYDCHQEAFEQSSNPPHVSLNFSTDCASCHTQDAWVPSTFDHDGMYFPIYSGKHQNEWSECVDCHQNVNNFEEFSCINCHLNPDTDLEHQGVQGYIYQDEACLACHPTGDADMSFDHNNTAFPLTGAHLGLDCILCHSGGYIGTPTDCAFCHGPDYSSSTNPEHTQLGISMDCASCHSTEAGWAPARFDIHDQYYELRGAHSVIRNDCAECHNGDYTTTPNTCFACHQLDYDQSQNPSHKEVQFSTDCASCHTEDAWVPSTFDHDGMYFPVYSGTHMGTWNECSECHTNSMDYSEFSCLGCHEHNMDDMDEKHMGVNGYSYNSLACLICHPTGLKDEGFDHGMTAFPLTGAHLNVACLDCHENGFSGTPTECKECHQEHFDMTTNPDHGAIGLSNDCAMCHTTEPGWMPAAFPDHDDFYELTGAHVLIKDDCASCHNGDYVGTPNTCDGCHREDFDNTTNPNHQSLGLSKTCDDCHTTNPGWMPATFDIHDNYYPLTGAHDLVRNDCAKCHMGDYTSTPTTCDGCHLSDYNNSSNPDHNALGIPKTCDDCHTTDPGWAPASFDIHDNYYALTGAHDLIRNDCAKCHMGDYRTTPTTCDGCHLADYNSSSNPPHNSLGIPKTCDDCHTTNPGWTPASFDIHDSYYALTGAHDLIRNDCAKCHMGDYINTPNTCDGCHLTDYNSSSNPNHNALGIPKTCDDCHTTNPGWNPATFDIHDNYYVLRGAHLVIKNDCFKCHMGSYSGTPNTCFGCHSTEYNNTTNPNHVSAGFPTACESCHSENAWIPSTWDHDNMYFPIYSGKHRNEWTQCVECHTTPGVFTTFSCIDCHEHNDKAQVDDDHDKVTGYSYNSSACYSCHPTGEK